MATVEQVILSDSLDERIKSNVETVTFFNPLTGEKLEIELGEANRKHFSNHLDKLTKYVDAARKVEAEKPKSASKSDLAKVREWARANGHDVGDRGRIKADIVAAYYAAQEAITHPAADAQAAGDEPVSVTDGIVDETDLVEVEFPQDEQDHPESRKSDSAEFMEFLKANMDEDGKITAESARAAGMMS